MADKIRVIFLHHSTGGNLIRDGRARERFASADPRIEFWDHGYDPAGLRGLLRVHAFLDRPEVGLRDGAGRLQLSTWHVPNNNTDPDGLAVLFQQPVTTPPQNALSRLLDFDVIIFKSCYPVTAIKDDAQLETYQQYYRTIRDTIDRFPEKLFIPMTPPPLRASLTTPEQAARARQFADWMTSDAFTGGRENIAVYDFFDALAAPASDLTNANTLQPRFCLPDPNDSHPNRTANEQTVDSWVNFVVAAIREAAFLNPIAA
jgi:hypothetical protein